VKFYFAAGSEFDELFVGMGAARVRKLFATAKENAPCIIFIDEIDAMARSRMDAKSNNHSFQTLNQLLTEMDGFSATNGIVVIGATNLAGSLDKALQRPGRFDREVVVDLPDVEGRRQIIDHYLQKVVADKEAIDTQMLAQGTIGMSGADLSNLVNEAALRCVAEGRDSVTMEDLQWAKDKIGMGRERKSAVMMPESLRLTAYHEGGHALVSLLTEGSMEIEKATIMPRGRALGYVLSLPTGDQTGQTKKQLLANLDVAMGGRAAEELIFGTTSRPGPPLTFSRPRGLREEWWSSMG